MAKRDEQHGFGEPSKGEEAETSYPASTSNDTSTSTSIDGTTSTSTDDKTSTSIDITTSSSIDSGRVSEQKEFDVCENLRDGDTTTRSDKSRGKNMMNWKKRKRIKDGPQVSLIPHFSDGVRKSRVRSRYFSQPFAKLRALLIAEMIDKGSFKSIDRHLIVLVDTYIKVRLKVDSLIDHLPSLVRYLITQGVLPEDPHAFDLANFECHRFEVNQHTVAEVMPVLLKSGQSASQEEAVEEMKDYRSVLQHWCRSTVMPEYGLNIFYDR
ncbi:hypothetical protein DY000_02061608 [Brassica cretica]|uniref:Uncharacterized protein n=1 Tax=Brassica cretica TaxID=69181 RepID=A0ABQ7ANA9_BRACR|nr:hypothetical protein DY000_02061608 [Brassica cretica]